MKSRTSVLEQREFYARSAEGSRPQVLVTPARYLLRGSLEGEINYKRYCSYGYRVLLRVVGRSIGPSVGGA